VCYFSPLNNRRVSNHPNVAFFFGVTVTSPHYSIVSEYYEHGSVAEYLRYYIICLLCCHYNINKHRKNPKVRWIDIVYMARGAAAGVLHLHKEHIIHRDLAARNLLLDGKLCGTISPIIFVCDWLTIFFVFSSCCRFWSCKNKSANVC
jgi:serine/threonine protein kinase